MEILVNGPIASAFIASQLNTLEELRSTGANSWFLGRVRADLRSGQAVVGIHYTAYEAMAKKVVQAIASETKAMFDIQQLDIWHSTGLVKTGEVSLLVLVSSAHRKASFKALEWSVNELKKRFPAWKKEILEDGGHHWIGEAKPDLP